MEEASGLKLIITADYFINVSCMLILILPAYSLISQAGYHYTKLKALYNDKSDRENGENLADDFNEGLLILKQPSNRVLF